MLNYEDRLNTLRNDNVLKTIVKQLNKRFPDCSITTDLDIYPLEDGAVDIIIIGAPMDDALSAIREVIPTYSLEGADNDDFTVFTCFTEPEPFPHDVKNLWE